MKGPIFVDELHRIIVEDEGTVVHVYRCPAGSRTIGNGHNIDANGLPDFIEHYLAVHRCITPEMVDYLRDKDISCAIDSCRKYIPTTTWEGLTPHRRMALINMVFNMGDGCLNPKSGRKYFKNMMRALVAGDIEGVCREMKDSVWYGQVQNRARRIIEMYRRG